LSSERAQGNSQPAVQPKRGDDSVIREALDTGLSERVVTDEELLQVGEKDPSLGIIECWEILGRLNIKTDLHISEAIRSGRPLKAPNDFRAYKDWTPMPRYIPQISRAPKFIIATLDIPFMGWYENGKLVGDTQVSMGRTGEETEAGIYRVEEKDADHSSKSYRNVYGRDAWMPWALRIYGTVWIHAGDIAERYYSRGCVYVPLMTAEKLYHWAELGTPVVIVDSLTDLDRALTRRL
jgi:hypothetical protein